MLKVLLLFFLTSSLFGLEVSLQAGKEKFQKYSTLHIKHDEPFLCEAIMNDFEETEKVICAFSKRPSSEFNTLQNGFFTIGSELKEGTFFLLIRPFHKMKLYSEIFDLHKEKNIFEASPKLAKHWMVLGYEDKTPFIYPHEDSEVAINFPYYNEEEMLPFIGGLDTQGHPVKITQVKDVKDYIKIKELYKEKNYEKCLDLIDEVVLEFPNSLFMSEFLFYKIKSYFSLEMFDDVIEESKIFLREYSADENIAEVLSMIAKSYAETGMNTNADYFFDRLFSEHKDSEFSKLGYVYRGEVYEASGASTKAIEYYQKALNETNDLAVAALAAYKLALYKISYSNKEEAALYVEKILGAKSEFFYEHFAKSLELMDLFKNEGDYLSAAGIAKAMLAKMDQKDELYEQMLSQQGIWFSKTEQKQEALEALNLYLQKYRYGTYETEVQTAKDSLFFDATEQNATQKLNHYDTLIENYAEDSIGNRALYEKAKLLLEENKYSDLLGLKASLLNIETSYPDVKELIQTSAIGAMQRSLENNACQEVLMLSNEHNVSLPSKWDEALYACFFKGGDFVKAKEIASKNINAQDIAKRQEWLLKYAELDFSVGEYQEALDATKDLIALMEINGGEYHQAYRLAFDIYQRLQKPKEMLQALDTLEKHFGDDYRDIDRYVAAMAYGVDQNDDTVILKYGTKVMDIQTKAQGYPQTPYVEFTLYSAYNNKERYQEALKVIASLDERELDSSQRSRQKYLLGNVYEKLWRNSDAKKAYEASVEADASSAWAKLSTSALELN